MHQWTRIVGVLSAMVVALAGSALRILPGGALRPVAGSPVLSGGLEPVSIAVHRHLVYVANTGTGGANYTGFILTPDGQLRPLPGSSVALPDGSGLGDVLFSPDGTRLVGTRVTTSLIDSFAVGRFGRLIAAPNGPFASPVAGPFGSAFRPTASTQLFVSNAHGGTGNGTTRTAAPATAASPPMRWPATATSPPSAAGRSPTGRPRRAG